ncbi:hypothetical protein NQZ68_027604 [Dissostichus eleginoides]|nr:hypothetical protein NQZ68_027604 [Dissostichus eleginoides]
MFHLDSWDNTQMSAQPLAKEAPTVGGNYGRKDRMRQKSGESKEPRSLIQNRDAYGSYSMCLMKN